MTKTWKIMIDNEQLTALKVTICNSHKSHIEVGEFVRTLHMPDLQTWPWGQFYQPELKIEVDRDMLIHLRAAVESYQNEFVIEDGEEHALEYWTDMIDDLLNEADEDHDPEMLQGFCY